ncbi:MAG: hypothetical protein ACOX2K_00265 [Bacillota bacterium]|jgi:rubredoxin
MKMDREQKALYMQAMYHKDLSERFMRASKTILIGSVFLWFIKIPPAYFGSMMGLGVLLFGIGYWLRRTYWICPSCDANLPSNMPAWQLERCPSCGLILDEQKKSQKKS